MAAVIVACTGVYGVLKVPEALRGPSARAVVVDSIENPTHRGAFIDWRGFDAWRVGLDLVGLTPGDVIDIGENDDGIQAVEIVGLRFQRALIAVVREAYPRAAWSAGHDSRGRPVARAAHDGRVVGLVMGLRESMRRWDLEEVEHG